MLFRTCVQSMYSGFTSPETQMRGPLDALSVSLRYYGGQKATLLRTILHPVSSALRCDVDKTYISSDNAHGSAFFSVLGLISVFLSSYHPSDGGTRMYIKDNPMAVKRCNGFSTLTYWMIK
jgi:hypothetical protein